jgi:hypothetical protein
MKFILVSLILITFGFSPLSQANEWSARSKETQSGKQSDYIAKSSKGNTSSALSPQAKNSASTDSLKNTAQSAPALQISAKGQVTTLNDDFWIYDAWVEFNSDRDYDGYYHSFTLEFDADSYFGSVAVYARLYLARDEVFQEYHTTSVFIIQGDDDSDALVVESELLSGFKPGDYELLVELYDANTDELVAVYDGYEDADLSLLPLESKDYDEVYVEPVVVVHEHGGSMGWVMLFAMGLLVLGKRFARLSV